MNKKYCIFDMDGTLTDSMGYWNALGYDYLRARGVEPPEDLFERFRAATLAESARYFMELGVPGPEERIVEELSAMMAENYRLRVPLKPGMAEYLEKLRAQGARLAVATATALPLVHACLRRLGVEDCFECFSSCESLGRSKEFPDVYLEAARHMGAKPEETVVFEDSLFAARTAQKAGFRVVGVYEAVNEEEWPALAELSEETITDWREAL